MLERVLVLIGFLKYGWFNLIFYYGDTYQVHYAGLLTQIPMRD
jgi:hypothetical protein